MVDYNRSFYEQLLEMESKLDATEKERLDLLARVGYAEGAGEEGLRRWDLAEQRAKAAESRLDSAVMALRQIRDHANDLAGDPSSWSHTMAVRALNEIVVERQCHICGTTSAKHDDYCSAVGKPSEWSE